MKKLKCWTKIQSDKNNQRWIRNGKFKTEVNITSPTEMSMPSGMYFIEITGRYDAVSLRKTRKEALSFAQKYMEGHDSC